MAEIDSQRPEKSNQIGTDFNAVTLARLQSDFRAISPEAAEALAAFQRATQKRARREAEFNTRARPAQARPDLKANLRSSAQMLAAREFETAKENLIALHPELGTKIARETAKGLGI